jgi:tRNA/rRNA methyltransferase
VPVPVPDYVLVRALVGHGCMMPVVRVVLNRPERAENVGAAARVVSNMGLAGLDLVAPCDYRTVEAWRMAWRSEDVLEQARVFETLADALAGATYVAGLAGREPKRVEPITPRQMGVELSALDEGAAAAIVFGCESKGLTEEELSLCQRRVRIPSHPRQPSLNLAQAVMVAAYESFLAATERPTGSGSSRAAPPRAAHEESERALASLKAALLEIDFLPVDNPEARFVEWRELLGRAGLTSRETRVLLAFARRVKNVGRIASEASGRDSSRRTPAPGSTRR